MTVVSKASAFPKSVEPGIPFIGPTPRGWSRGPLSEHLFEQQRPIRMIDDTEYDLVTVKRSRGGVVARERLKGKDISVKSQFALKAGDFLISKRQIVHGACGIVPYHLDGSIASNEYAVLGGRPTIDLNYLNYLSHSIYFQQTCFHSSIGVHVEKMIFKLDRWLSWDFNLPPLREQTKIVEIFSTWDRAIAAQERLVANAQVQKIALMQTLLTGKTRLRGFSRKWKTKKLSHFCTVRRGASPRPITDPKWFATSGRGWVRIADVTRSKTELLEKTTQYLSPEGVDKSVPVEPGELIMSICATIGVPKIVGIPVCIHDGFVLFRDLSPQLSLAFLFHFLEFIADKLASGGQPGTQKNLNTSIVSDIEFPDISKKEQETIALILNVASNEIRLFEDQLAIMKQEKSALMSQLLTGRRRIEIRDSME